MSETTTTTTTPSQPDTTAYCLGRFIVDVPTGSKLTGGSYKYNFAQIDKPVAMSFENFEQEIKTLEDTRRATKHEKDPSLLRAIQRPDRTSVVLAYWEEPYSAGIVKVDGYKWIDGMRFLLRDEVGASKKEFLEQGLKAMTDTLSRLRARLPTEIPKESGYCFEGGFIANEEWENEEAAMDFRLADQPDVVLSVDLFPLAARKRDKPLLDRMGGALQMIGGLATGVHVLRKGERNFGKSKGQEYLATAPNSGGMRAHMFTWETQGDATLDTPFVSIELSSGHKDDKGNAQQTHLSDELALKLWDRIVGSFRLRPTGPAPARTSGATPPKTPLGELVATGRACPQPGWWECAEESRPVQGGRRQFFRGGDQMPHAVLQGEPSVWQKLKGEEPTYRVATVWKLVDYDEPAAGKVRTAATPLEAPTASGATASGGHGAEGAPPSNET